MMTRTLPSAIVLAAVFSTGCGGDHPVAPTQFSTVANPSLAVTPSPLSAQAETVGVCPVAPSFTVPFHLIVGSHLSFVVTDVTLRFTDARGVAQPQVTLPAPIPITQFGAALAEARAQDFGLSLPIACGMGRSGTLLVIVHTRDDAGRTLSTQLTAPVR